MRTIGYRTNVLFILAAAFGLLAALGRPWYASASASLGEEARIGEMRGTVEASFARLGREVTADDGSRGWDAFTSTDAILVALLAVAVVTAVGSLWGEIERPCRELLRLVTLAMLGIVVVKLVNTPDTIGLVERRQGVWIALGVTGIMASSAAAIYSSKLTRRTSRPGLVDYNPNLIAPPRSHAFDTQYVPPLDRG